MLSKGNNAIGVAVRRALYVGAMASAVVYASTASAQDDAALEEITVTGTRITVPGVESASPIFSVASEEIDLQGQPEVEKILRLLPITKPADGSAVNNGTAGVATVDLRGLGAQRNLVLVDGKRATPYNYNGIIDTSTIPTALIDRIDIITGGASAVYGSDAISGALNFVMKRDFEGVDLRGYYSQTDESDGDDTSLSLTLGANVADGRGNVALNMNWNDREAVLLGARPLGQLGIATDDGSNYAEFLAGQAPAPGPAGCGGPGSVVSGGSTTTLPTRVSIAGGSGLGQFREDGSLQDNCSVFNFNPFNYYQTPLERFGAAALGHFEVNEHVEAYGRLNYSNTSVRQQVAASGIFGNTFFTPLANPFITDQARGVMIGAAEADRTSGALNVAGVPDPANPGEFLFENWRDINGNGVVDIEDDLLISYRRRTVEFGERSTTYGNNAFQLTAGLRGTIIGDWTYDTSVQYGQTDRTNVSAGYTNVASIENAVNAVDVDTCRTGGDSCVPINLFGGFGAITPAMAAYSSATAIDRQTYEQTIYFASATGPIDALHIPSADQPVSVSIGYEFRDESALTTPDECWKLAPSSCLGGAGGNILPRAGGFDVSEFFGEAIIPIVSGMTGIQQLDLELGIRASDYSSTGSNTTWKAGVSYRPIESLRFRAMVQQAIRAPNVGELAAPNTTSLENATLDPCSVANAGNIDAALQALCVSTGMSAAQVGVVEDIVSGQINAFAGTDLNNLPDIETADTLTVGFVYSSDLDLGPVQGLIVSLDYYDIDIDDVIGEFAPQEVLDGCYTAGETEQCTKIRRIGGALTLPGSGVELFTTNLVNQRAEGIELGLTTSVEMGKYGGLDVSFNYNQYLTADSQSSSTTPVLDCLGYYGTSCGGPLPESRWIQRTTWNFLEDFQVSYLWSHLGSTDIEPGEAADAFPEFRSIDSYNYVDLTATWQVTEEINLSLAVNNLFGEDPPVVGNEAGTTSANSGNTFPSAYTAVGSVYRFGFRYAF
ncbi:MAG TPA: TonB-dependent receptor [Woeseiaceae bacterium]|nr:TonB-dependent receptor [Woeseiaceae bacterium]